MFKDIIDNYLNEKYEQYCLEVLSKQNTGSSIFSNINCLNSNTILDELIFARLYYPEQYYEILEKTRVQTYKKVSNLSNNEINFLFLKFWSDTKESLTIRNDLKIYYVANELTNLINLEVKNCCLNEPEEILRLFLHQLKDDISKLENSCGNSCFENNWEEFCFQIQYGEKNILNLLLRDIKEHIYTSLTNFSIKEIILLFTQTDYFIYDDRNLLPHLSCDEMTFCLVPKLLEDIKEIAELENLYLIT